MNWDQFAADALAVLHEVVSDLRQPLERVAEDMARRLAAGGKLLICGNGGSAADAQHVAGELVNRFLRDRRPYAAVALSTDTSVLTSIANDVSYDEVFARQVRALGRPGDALLVLSTSGASPNILRAVEEARSVGGIRVVAFAGAAGSPLVRLADEALCIRSAAGTPRIQEGHLLLLHALCERIEERLADADNTQE